MEAEIIEKEEKAKKELMDKIKQKFDVDDHLDHHNHEQKIPVLSADEFSDAFEESIPEMSVDEFSNAFEEPIPEMSVDNFTNSTEESIPEMSVDDFANVFEDFTPEISEDEGSITVIEKDPEWPVEDE